MIPNYKCNICKNQIESVRFHCLVCYDTDHCESCQREKRGDHNHPFMKYKNVQNGKLNKSQRIYPPSTQGVNVGGVGAGYDQSSANPLNNNNNNNNTLPFMLGNKNIANSCFYQPMPSPSPQQQQQQQQQQKNYLASSNTNLQNNNGMLHFQNNQRPPVSPLAQTMPTGLKSQTPTYSQNFFFNNNLQQSQNLNIPINHLREQQNPLNDMFTHQVSSQTYTISSIPQQRLTTYGQNSNNNNAIISSNSSGSLNSASFGMNDIKIQRMDSVSQITAKKGEIYSVQFIIKNGGQFQFPEGGILRGDDNNIYSNIKKPVNPLKQNELQKIDFELKAPNIISAQFLYFKVEFPTNTDLTHYKQIGPRFDFYLTTTQ